MKSKFKIEKSNFPEGKDKYLIRKYKVSQYGMNIVRVFKGSYKECKEKIKELKENESRSNASCE